MLRLIMMIFRLGLAVGLSAIAVARTTTMGNQGFRYTFSLIAVAP